MDEGWHRTHLCASSDGTSADQGHNGRSAILRFQAEPSDADTSSVINRPRLIRFAWAMYQFAPMIAVVVVAGLTLGWAPTLFLGSLFVALFVWLLRSAKRDVRRMQTDTGVRVPDRTGIADVLQSDGPRRTCRDGHPPRAPRHRRCSSLETVPTGQHLPVEQTGDEQRRVRSRGRLSRVGVLRRAADPRPTPGRRHRCGTEDSGWRTS